MGFGGWVIVRLLRVIKDCGKQNQSSLSPLILFFSLIVFLLLKCAPVFAGYTGYTMPSGTPPSGVACYLNGDGVGFSSSAAVCSALQAERDLAASRFNSGVSGSGINAQFVVTSCPAGAGSGRYLLIYNNGAGIVSTSPYGFSVSCIGTPVCQPGTGYNTLTGMCEACPANSSGTAPACVCNVGFKFDAAGTSCVPVAPPVICPIDKVAELTDPVALLYENGTYSATKPDLDHLTPATQSGLACIKQKVAALNCYMTPKPTSGYRPTAYQKHILEVYDQWQKINNNNDPLCAETKAFIEKEFKKHSRFARRPADPSVKPSNHSQLDAQGKPAGKAVDISFVPDDANISADSIACQCNMYRPEIKTDPIHYQPRTCLP